MYLVSLTEKKFEATCILHTSTVATASFSNVQIALIPLVQTYVCFIDVVISVKVVSEHPSQGHPLVHVSRLQVCPHLKGFVSLGKLP